MELESLLKTTVPSSNWSEWGYFNGHGNNDDGYGYPTKEISAPDTGLYYLWIYLAGNNVKSTYGYILVDNLEPEITLDKITLPETRQVEIGKTITLTPTFNPEKTTNKIVTWSSSDESIATVSNTGVVTGKKIGGAIITVTSQDGSKKASCTVTVTDVLDSEVSNTDTNTGSQSAKENGNAGNSKATAEPVAETVKNATAQNGKKLNGTESKNLGPQAGASATIVAVVIGGMAFSVVMAKKAKKYRGIK
ncbi:MAG: Ig domain-containing protein [Bacilli bacterium]|nr:Ig domain-containing protein [Bacilli bacterium]